MSSSDSDSSSSSSESSSSISSSSASSKSQNKKSSSSSSSGSESSSSTSSSSTSSSSASSQANSNPTKLDDVNLTIQNQQPKDSKRDSSSSSSSSSSSDSDEEISPIPNRKNSSSSSSESEPFNSKKNYNKPNKNSASNEKPKTQKKGKSSSSNSLNEDANVTSYLQNQDGSPFDEGRYSNIKDWFSELPQPKVINRIPESANQYLKDIQDNITKLREHIRVIQEEEITEMRAYTDKLNTQKKGSEEEEVRARNSFQEKIARLRFSRKKFRATLFDNIQQRNGLLASFQIQKQLEEEKDAKLDQFHDPKGIDLFLLFFLFLATLIIVLHIVFFDFANFSALNTYNVVTDALGGSIHVNTYSAYIGIAMMVFFGFGFFYSNLKKHAFSSIGQAFFLASFSMIFGILVNGLLYYIEIDRMQKQFLTIEHLIDGLYVAAAVLVSMGVVAGRATFRQLSVMMVFEVMCYCVNHWLYKYKFFALSPGMAAEVHVFGAIFGLCVNFILHPFKLDDNERHVDHRSKYNQDIFSTLGALVLWIMFPYFNAVYAPAGTQFIVVFNTVVSLCSSTIVAFTLPHFFGGRFALENVRLAALSGGIIMGSAVNFIVSTWVAMILGMVGGIIVFIGTYWIAPLFEGKLGWKDTSIAGWLHGVAGCLSACFSMVAVKLSENDSTGDVWGFDYKSLFNIHPYSQGSHQVYGLLVSVGIALGGGIIAGVLMRFLPNLRPKLHETDYSDHREWRVPSDFPPHVTRDPSNSVPLQTVA